MTEYSTGGKTTLTPEVLMTMARMAALEIEGVRGMAPVRGRGLLKRGEQGVRYELEGGIVFLDLFLVLEKEINIRDIGRRVQEHVARVVTELTGLEVGHVNIHVEDISSE